MAEDESSVRWATRMLLDVDEHKVTEAENGGKALDLFETGKFDLVITDFQMPSMTGNELAEKIKTLSPAQPILLVTAYGEKLANQHLAVDATLAKPFTFEQLRNAISKLLSTGIPALAHQS
jgi:CheY-like chemotaxis protein